MHGVVHIEYTQSYPRSPGLRGLDEKDLVVGIHMNQHLMRRFLLSDSFSPRKLPIVFLRTPT
jgi:hypothetical protein